MSILSIFRELAWRLLGRPNYVDPGSRGISNGAPLNAGVDGYGSFGDWNPWSRYDNPIAAFFDYYQLNPWVRAVCDTISNEALSDGWILNDLTTKNSTHPEYVHLETWLNAWGFDHHRQHAILDLAICRNAFFFKERNGLKQVRRLIRISPRTMKPIGDAEHGVIAWKQTVGNKHRVFPASDILHIKGPNPVSDIIGMPVLTSASTDIEADDAMALFNRAYFGNGTQAGTILTWDQADLRNPKSGEWTENDEKRATNLWAQMSSYIERRFQNPTSAHLPLLLRGKWQVHGMGQAKADAQFLDGRKFNARLVCALYGFPVEALGMGEKGALGGSLADSAQAQLDGVVLAYERMFDEQFTFKFLQQELGIQGLQTMARPRPAKITLEATQGIYNLARSDSFTRDELRAIARHPRLATGGNVVVAVAGSNATEQPDATTAPSSDA